MLNVSIIPYLIIINLIILFLFTISGVFLLYITKRLTENTSTNIFIGASIGVIIYVTTYAIIMSSGRTVFAIMPVFFFYIYKFSTVATDYKIRFQAYVMPFLFLCIYTIIYLFLSCLTLFDLKSGELGVFNSYYSFDSVIYGRISKYMAITGKENQFGISNLFMTIDNFPYHYLELWYCSMVSLFFEVNETIVLLLVVYTFFNGLIALGIYIIAKSIIGSAGMINLLAPIMIWFLCGVPWSDFLQSITTFSVASFTLGKLSIIYWIIISVFLAILKDKLFLAVSILCILPLLFISTAIGVGLSLILLVSLNLLTKNETVISNIKYFYLLAIIGTWIVVFYVITKGSFSGNTSVLAAKSDIVFSWKTMINIIGATILQFGYLYLLLILLILLNLRYLLASFPILKLFIICIIFFFSSLVVWGIFHTISDSVQLFHNLTIPALNIFSTIFILHLTIKGVQFRIYNILLSSIWIASIFIIHKDFSRAQKADLLTSVEFKYAAKQAIDNSNAIGCNFPSPGKINNTSIFSDDYYVFQERYIVGYLNNNLIMLTYFDDTSAYRNSKIMAGLKYSPFFEYTRKQINEGKFVSIGKTQLDFIRQHNIQFAIVEPNTKPYIDTLILKNVKSKIVDEKSKIELWKF